ncbi:MAG: hypothetical protein PUH70_02340 [Clostridiales bacterium]|nr:hypothetical protein [Clostridiales bacterium]MDY5514278.1 hypothetical protein [Candidatus Ventricola sp.]
MIIHDHLCAICMMHWQPSRKLLPICPIFIIVFGDNSVKNGVFFPPFLPGVPVALLRHTQKRAVWGGKE